MKLIRDYDDAQSFLVAILACLTFSGCVGSDVDAQESREQRRGKGMDR